jgi:hypothetical protein
MFMDILDQGQFESLATQRHAVCVSLYLPTHRVGPETRQDPIRLKNLIKHAESLLFNLGQRPASARRLLAPARELADAGEFWRQQGDGLALFASDDFFRRFCLPIPVREAVSVGEHFHVSPLLPLVAEDETFYLLALSWNRVRFFRGNSTRLIELDVPGIPQGVDEALKYDVRESQLQVHSGAGGSAAGKEGAVFTGQGVGVDDEEERTREFLLQVERAVRGWLRNQHAPLLLAGVIELVSAYRGLNKYRTLLEQNVMGNPDLSKAHELHAAARKLVLPHFQSSREKAIAKYQDLTGSHRSVNDLKAVLLSAWDGEVEAAFVPAGIERWGKFDRDQHAVELHEVRQPGDEDLIAAIATQTAVHRGAIYMVKPDQMPDQSEVAAVLRY